MALPHINDYNPCKFHEFCEKLLGSEQALETTGKLNEINGYGFVRLTLDKLQGIRSGVVRTDNDWQDTKFIRLVETLKNWTCRNHKLLSEDNRTNPCRNQDKVYQANQHQTECVCCKNLTIPLSADCQTVKANV